MTKIRVYYRVCDCGDGSVSVDFFTNQADLDAAQKQDEEDYGHVQETNGTYEDIVIEDYEVVG